MVRWAMALSLLALVACQSAVATPTALPVAPVVTATRVDVLNQANAAFDRGDRATASGLYERVINTPPSGEAADTTVVLDDFARFRDSVSLLDLGREDEARAQVDALQRADASAPLARLGAQLWDEYGMVGDMHGACAQVEPQVVSQAGQTLAALQSLGVSVRPEGLCS